MPLLNPPHIIASVDLMTDYDDVFDTIHLQGFASVLPTFTHYVDNNSTPTIASNLLEANAVLSWQGSYQSAKRLEPLLCATIGHTPPVMRDNSWYRRHTCGRVASVHMCTRGRDQPVILGAQTAQPRELQIVGEQPGAVNAAYLSPSAYATVCHGRYGVEVRLST